MPNTIDPSNVIASERLHSPPTVPSTSTFYFSKLSFAHFSPTSFLLNGTLTFVNGILNRLLPD